MMEAAAGYADQSANQGRRPKAVQPVHDPAVARDKRTRVLGAAPALDPGFEQITALRRDGK
jgi:hypothetical protein